MDAPAQLMDGCKGDASHATVDHLDGRIYCCLKRHADVAEPAHALARKRYVANVANQVINTTKITTVNVLMVDGQAMAIHAKTEEIHRIHAENIELFGKQPLTGPPLDGPCRNPALLLRVCFAELWLHCGGLP